MYAEFEGVPERKKYLLLKISEDVVAGANVDQLWEVFERWGRRFGLRV